MHGETGMPEYTIIAFVAVVFIGGAIAVYKFMKAGKK